MSGSQESNIGQQPAQIANQGSGTKKRNELTQERVRELFDYDPDTGIVTRKIPVYSGRWGKVSRVKAGDVVGTLDSHGYFQVKIDGRLYILHRVIWLWVTGEWPSKLIDHLSGEKTNNSWTNLRLATPFINSINRNEFSRDIDKYGNLNVTGVTMHRRDGVDKYYLASISNNSSFKFLGYFRDFTNAVATRLAAEQCLDWDKHYNTSSAYQYMQNYLQESKCQKS